MDDFERGVEPAGTDRTPLRLFLSAAGCGLVAGWLELGLVLALRAVDPRVSMDSLRTNRHFVWMIPVAGMALFAAVGVAVALWARFRPGAARRHAWRVFVALAVLTVLLAAERVHVAACVALACGVGWRFGPRVEAAGRGKLGRAVVAVAALGAVVLTGVESWRVTSAERRALATLPKPTAATPNLLLIVLDNVRAESLSLYGRDRPTTPNLERLARSGVCFTQARSTAPWTLPSHASMLTGEWCHRLSFDFDRPLDGARPTLAEALARQGYSTAGFIANTYYCNARYGLNRGFARYEDCYENQTVSPFEVVRSSGLGKRVVQALGHSIHVENGGTSVRKTAAMINRDALGWLDGRPRDRPFFLFLNYYDAHGPFIPPDGPDPRFGLAALPERERIETLKRFQRLSTGKNTPADGPADRIEREANDVFLDSYESCIAYLDRQIGLLFDELERRGLRKNTLVVVTSDHGEHFKEHGFSGHGLSLYRREVHVPLLIFPPGGVAQGRVVSEPVSLRDIAATSVDLLGLADRAPFPGRTLARLWATDPEDRPPHAPVLSEVAHQKNLEPVPGIPATAGTVRSVVSAGKVYIRGGGGREELFDLKNDPHETTNLVGSADLRPPLEHFRDLLDRLLVNRGDPRFASTSSNQILSEGSRHE